VVLLRLALDPGPAPTYAALGAELGLTASEAHAAVERAVAAKLAIKDEAGKPSVVRAALRAFVQHGARYCFSPTQGGLTRGVPTGYAASPLNDRPDPAGQRSTACSAVEERERPAASPLPALPECSRCGAAQPGTRGAAGPVRCGARRQRP
jgi:hypothetical protein